jgi:S-formylglutathione hydrolase FrmB
MRCWNVCGLGVVAVAAGAGGQASAQLAPPHARAVPSGEVRLERFHSAALGVTKGYAIYLPAAYAANPGRRFPVLYLLHGYSGNEGTWVTQGRADAIADSAFAAGVAPMILVMPDGDQSYWADWSASPGTACDAAAQLGEAAATACVAQSRYGEYVRHDLTAMVDARYRTIPGRRGRGIAGISAGGTGALVLAFNAPDIYSAVAALSAVAMPLSTADRRCGEPVQMASSLQELESALGRPMPGWRMRWGTDTTQWWRFDPSRAARRLAAVHGPHPAIRLEAGDADPLTGGTCALAALLDSLGMAPSLTVSRGAHDWTLWQARLGEVLSWFARVMLPPR